LEYTTIDSIIVSANKHAFRSSNTKPRPDSIDSIDDPSYPLLSRSICLGITPMRSSTQTMRDLTIRTFFFHCVFLDWCSNSHFASIDCTTRHRLLTNKSREKCERDYEDQHQRGCSSGDDARLTHSHQETSSHHHQV
jgi:hypothetical protein